MKLICINDKPEIYSLTNIEIGKVYETFDIIRMNSADYKLVSIIIKNNEHSSFIQEYPKSCFISIEEHRENQLKKLNI